MKILRMTSYPNFLSKIFFRKKELLYTITITLQCSKAEFAEYQKNKLDYIFNNVTEGA